MQARGFKTPNQTFQFISFLVSVRYSTEIQLLKTHTYTHTHKGFSVCCVPTKGLDQTQSLDQQLMALFYRAEFNREASSHSNSWF